VKKQFVAIFNFNFCAHRNFAPIRENDNFAHKLRGSKSRISVGPKTIFGVQQSVLDLGTPYSDIPECMVLCLISAVCTIGCDTLCLANPKCIVLCCGSIQVTEGNE